MTSHLIRRTGSSSLAFHAFVLAALVLVAVLDRTAVEAFAIDRRRASSTWTSSSTSKLDRLPSIQKVLENSRLHAIIYGADGEVIPDEEASGDCLSSDDSSTATDTTTTTTTTSTSSQALIEFMTTQIPPSTLTAIACAFAPPPHSDIRPSMVVSTTVVTMSSTLLDIALAVPSSSSEGLVQVLVSVALPKPGSANGEDTDLGSQQATLMENLRLLELQAHDRLQDLERRQDGPSTDEEQRVIILRQTMQEPPDAIDLPDWWTFPELKITLADECDSLVELLNEDDFTHDRVALCRHELLLLRKRNPDEPSAGDTIVLQAFVAQVGPSGLYLRAQVQHDADGVATIKDISLPFLESAVASTADEVRSFVLDLVESLEGVAEPALSAVEEQDAIPSTKEVLGDASIDKTKEETAQAATTPQSTIKTDVVMVSEETIAEARRQPKSSEDEARLAAKYGAMDDLGERAFAILQDLYMI